MHGIAERIQDRRDLIVDRRRQLERVERRDDEVFGERAGPVHADADGVAAQVAASGAAVAAVAAGDVTLARDAIARLEARDFAADLHDLAAVFVPDRHRHRDGLLRPGVPVIDVHVRAADGAALDADQDVVRAGDGFGDLLQVDAGSRASFD